MSTPWKDNYRPGESVAITETPSKYAPAVTCGYNYDAATKYVASPMKHSVTRSPTPASPATPHTPASAQKAPASVHDTPMYVAARSPVSVYEQAVHHNTVEALSELANNLNKTRVPAEAIGQTVRTTIYSIVFYLVLIVVGSFIYNANRPYCTGSDRFLSGYLPCVQCPSDAQCGRFTIKGCNNNKVLYKNSVCRISPRLFVYFCVF